MGTFLRISIGVAVGLFLFLGLFFVLVGALLDNSTVANGGAALLAIVAVAVVLGWIALYVAVLGLRFMFWVVKGRRPSF
jgi:Kef-type K+ transport system membrane component KefB